MSRFDILTAARAPMRKGDTVIVIRSVAGDTSIIGKKGVVYNIHKMATGQAKVTVRLEDGALYHLDDSEIEVIPS